MSWSSLGSLEIPTKADVQEVIPTTSVQSFETLNTAYGNLFKIKYSNYGYPIIFGSLRFHISAGDGEGTLYTFPTAYRIYCNGLRLREKKGQLIVKEVRFFRNLLKNFM